MRVSYWAYSNPVSQSISSRVAPPVKIKKSAIWSRWMRSIVHPKIQHNFKDLISQHPPTMLARSTAVARKSVAISVRPMSSFWDRRDTLAATRAKHFSDPTPGMSSGLRLLKYNEWTLSRNPKLQHNLISEIHFWYRSGKPNLLENASRQICHPCSSCELRDRSLHGFIWTNIYCTEINGFLKR